MKKWRGMLGERNKMKKNKPLYRIVVEPGGGNGGYPRYEKFWHIEKWSDKYERYLHHGYDGLAFTKWGMWRAIIKELKRLNAGYHAEYYTINGERLDKDN